MSKPDPLDDVAFLARSAHRVGVLKILADGPMTRRDLHDETGISQPTLGRILEPFQDRNWVERRGQEYALNAWGHLLAEDFGELLDTVESIQRLSDVVRHLPTDEMDFDVREFRDATITSPETGDVFRHIRRIEELFYGADDARILSPTVAPGSSEDHRERYLEFLDSEKHIESIVPTGALDQGLVDEESARLMLESMETGRASTYLYEGPIPFLLAVTDNTALLASTDEQDIPVALVETENPTIQSWVESKLDEYREQSTELTLDDLPE